MAAVVVKEPRLTKFIHGRELNRAFYLQAVCPVLRSKFPRLRYSAGLLGAGSEVLGYDTERSTDHDWGPRAQIFLAPADCASLRGGILGALRRGIPPNFEGHSTRFVKSDPDGVRVRVGSGRRGTPIVWVGTIKEFFFDYLFVDPFRPLRPVDWLTLPSQKLLSIAAGPIYRDDLGLGRVRARFRYYPRDVWLHMLSVQWLRIAEEEAFVGRTAEVGDNLGSRVLAARQVREAMRLAFLLERRFYPYDKWFGSAFAELRIAKTLSPSLEQALDARDIRARESALSKVYGILAQRQNALGLAKPLPESVSKFHDRPFLVIHAGKFASALRSQIKSLQIRGLTRIGSVDQFADTEELGSHREQRRVLQGLIRS